MIQLIGRKNRELRWMIRCFDLLKRSVHKHTQRGEMPHAACEQPLTSARTRRWRPFESVFLHHTLGMIKYRDMTRVPESIKACASAMTTSFSCDEKQQQR